MKTPKAICKLCKHHRHHSPTAPLVWYNWFCHHPTQARPKMVDCVTGETGFALGNTCVDSKYPNCRDVNTDGECELYEIP